MARGYRKSVGVHDGRTRALPRKKGRNRTSRITRERFSEQNIERCYVVFRSIVFKIGILVFASIVALSFVVMQLSIQSLQILDRSLTEITEKLLEGDLQSKSQRDTQSLLNYGAALAKYLSDISASPLWEFQNALLDDYTQNLLALPDIYYVVIYDEGRSIISGEKKESRQIQVFREPVLNGNRVIGEVELALSLNQVSVLQEENLQVMEKLLSSFELNSSQIQRQQVQQLGLILLGVCAGILAISIFMIYKIASPIRKMNKIVKQLSTGTGDLTVEMDIQSRDEVGVLAKAFNGFLGTVRGLIAEIAQSSNGIKETSDSFENIVINQTDSSQITFDRMEKIERNSQSISNTLEEITAELEQIASQSIVVNKHTRAISENTVTTEKEIEGINTSSQQIVEVMNRANREMKLTIESVQTLTENAQNIETILDTISSIAEQTNLLALNAAIEAARAGEAGRGFAVVADEIRKLAEESKTSANKIAQILRQISDQSKQALEKTTGTTSIVSEASSYSEKIRMDLGKILRSVHNIRDMVTEASELTATQSESTDGISKAIIDATQNTLAMGEEIEGALSAMKTLLNEIQRIQSSSSMLNEAFGRLDDQIHRFKT